ncbi:hypothetical protein E2C01_075439 [Portunus trituberculatus]|uniref:Uncharacterized protein n=1 Tax=Portunus trituberculatus TaxID=210409 RepID=A0A5B7IFT9_PORTR|nr:hypothetical protein [Portunus trituberculatus]
MESGDERVCSLVVCVGVFNNHNCSTRNTKLEEINQYHSIKEGTHCLVSVCLRRTTGIHKRVHSNALCHRRINLIKIVVVHSTFSEHLLPFACEVRCCPRGDPNTASRQAAYKDDPCIC